MDYVGDATYSPEDNKLRLYAYSRLSPEVFAKIKSAGFRWAPKQELFVAPSWTPQREDLLRELCGDIGDEDYSPEERAADRAERFAGYIEKREAEAVQSADNYANGPTTIGYQSESKAQREADRHNRKRTFAVGQWSKAEYWQARTHAVIAHAMYKSDPRVRRGRILELEKELRSIVARFTPQEPRQQYTDSESGDLYVLVGPKGRGAYWAKESRLESEAQGYSRWVEHLKFRIDYERAMLGDEGGTAADADIVIGGHIRGFRVVSVKRSPVTSRVVSVEILHEGKPRRINVERLPEGAYIPPTEEQLREFLVSEATRKAEIKAAKPKAPSLINPTEEDAQKLQAMWNASAKHPSEIWRMTQSEYSDRSKGSYGMCSAVEIDEQGKRRWAGCYGMSGRETVFKLRIGGPSNQEIYGAYRVVVITDKPQKPIPWSDLEDAKSRAPSPESLFDRMGDIYRIANGQWMPSEGPDRDLVLDAKYSGLMFHQSETQFGLTEAGKALHAQWNESKTLCGAS
jgi:hypothetical protein